MVAYFWQRNVYQEIRQSDHIYGHHMNSGKMFADLEKYKDEDFTKNIRQSCSAPYGEMNSIRYLQHLQHPFIQEMILIITVLSKQEQWMIIKNLLLPLRKNRFIRQEQQQNIRDKLLTLSTCEYSQKNGRMVLVAKEK